MNFLKLTMIDTPSPRDADASKNKIEDLQMRYWFDFNGCNDL